MYVTTFIHPFLLSPPQIDYLSKHLPQLNSAILLQKHLGEISGARGSVDQGKVEGCKGAQVGVIGHDPTASLTKLRGDGDKRRSDQREGECVAQRFVWL